MAKRLPSVRRRFRSWVDRESALAEKVARGTHGRLAANVAESLELAARARRLGWTKVARALVMCARHVRVEETGL